MQFLLKISTSGHPNCVFVVIPRRFLSAGKDQMKTNDSNEGEKNCVFDEIIRV